MEFELTNIVVVIMSIYIITQFIARITPTKKDDEIVGIIGKILNIIFLKSNIKELMQDQLKANVFKEAVGNAMASNKSVAEKIEKEIDKAAKNIEKEIKEKKISIETAIKRIGPTPIMVKNVEDKINKKLSNFNPRTRLGLRIKNIFRG